MPSHRHSHRVKEPVNVSGRGEHQTSEHKVERPIKDQLLSQPRDEHVPSEQGERHVRRPEPYEDSSDESSSMSDSSDYSSSSESEVTQSEMAYIPNNVGELDDLTLEKKDLSKVNFETLPVSPNLKSVSLLGCDVTLEKVSALFYRLETFETLQSLDLSGTKMKTVFFSNAALPLSLEVFRLRKCNIDKLKFNNLSLLVNLKELDFSYNDLSTCPFSSKSLPKSLEKLCLENCNLNPKAGFPTRDLLNVIRGLNKLEEVNLSRNDLSPHSNTFLSYLPDGIKVCTLEHTKIRLSEVTKMSELKQELIRLTQLKSLSFPNVPNKKVRAKFHNIVKETGYVHHDYNVPKNITSITQN